MAKKKSRNSIEELVELARIRLACGVESPFPKQEHLFFPDFVKIPDLTPQQIVGACRYIDKLERYSYKIEAVSTKSPKTRNWRDTSYDDVQEYNLYIFDKKKPDK